MIRTTAKMTPLDAQYWDETGADSRACVKMPAASCPAQAQHGREPQSGDVINE